MPDHGIIGKESPKFKNFVADFKMINIFCVTITLYETNLVLFGYILSQNVQNAYSDS